MKKNQKYTSADTSVNSTKLPAIYGKLPWLKEGELSELGAILDYGCGKFIENYALPENVKGYDPFNYNKPENLTGGYDKVLSSNVLNVVMERDVRVDILRAMKAQLKPGGVVLVTVYTGRGDGVGRVTKKDCWQENRKLRSYADEAGEVFADVTFAHGMMICRG